MMEVSWSLALSPGETETACGLSRRSLAAVPSLSKQSRGEGGGGKEGG